MTDRKAVNVAFYERLFARLGWPLCRGARVLDLGCGDGGLVRALRAAGFDAWGCDVVLGGSSDPHLAPIEVEPYRLPFADDSFDLVLSEQVFEHVMNPEEVIEEVARVTAPGGRGLHVFPARWRPVEGHVLVPLAGVVRSKWWLWLWAAVGVRNRFQRGWPVSRVWRENDRFLREHTNYMSRRRIRRLFSRCFEGMKFAEAEFLRESPRRAGRVLGGVAGVVGCAYSGLWMRVVFSAGPRSSPRRQPMRAAVGAFVEESRTSRLPYGKD